MRKQILLLGLLMLTAACLTAQTLTVTLSPSNYNGTNISCFGAQDGSITANVTGGTPPYTYRWSNEETTQTITQLASGYYHVEVIDANGDAGKDEITLDEPKSLDFGMGPQFYANGYNTSCFFCADGAINIDIGGGVTPYTFAWNDGSTFQNRTGLQAKYYQVIVTDANGCLQKRDGITLTSPDRDDWQMTGNNNTNPATQFLGTLDNKDLCFKTNNVERFKIKSNGVADFKFDVNIQTSVFFKNNKVITYQPAQNNLPDIMSFGAAPNPTPFAIANCITPQLNTFQFNGTIQLFGNSAAGGNLNVMEVGFDGYNAIIDATGNSTDPNSNRLLLNYHCGRDVFVGNLSSGDLTANHNLFVNGNTKIDGSVGIGIDPSSISSQSTPYKLVVAGKLGANEIWTSLGAGGTWPDYVFDKNYKYKSLKELEDFIIKENHLPGMPSAKEMESQDKFNIAQIMIKQQEKLEEAYLYIFELKKEIDNLRNEIKNK